MAVVIVCDACGRAYHVSADSGVVEIPCSCGRLLAVPGAAVEQAPPPEEAPPPAPAPLDEGPTDTAAVAAETAALPTPEEAAANLALKLREAKVL